MTSDDIRNHQFEPGRGYRQDGVDYFLQQVADVMDGMAAQIVDSNEKMLILAQKVEEYRGQEETLKTALINAQRMGEVVVHEAKQKAEQMVRDASGQAELLRQQAQQEIEGERGQLEKLQSEVSQFKATILNLYKQHIEALSALDEPVEKAEATLHEFQERHEGGASRYNEPLAFAPLETPAEPEEEEDEEETVVTLPAERKEPQPQTPPSPTGEVNLFGGVKLD